MDLLQEKLRFARSRNDKIYLLLMACRSRLDGQINGQKKSKNDLNGSRRKLTYENSVSHGPNRSVRARSQLLK